jgi:hypothetical protein
MSSSQLPDQQEIFELETRHWYNRAVFFFVVGVVFVFVPFILAYSAVTNRYNSQKILFFKGVANKRRKREKNI